MSRNALLALATSRAGERTFISAEAIGSQKVQNCNLSRSSLTWENMAEQSGRNFIARGPKGNQFAYSHLRD